MRLHACSQIAGRASDGAALYPHQVPWNDGIAVREGLNAIPTVRVQLDLTAPVKIHIALIVLIHSNEHEFLLKNACGIATTTS